MRTLLVPIAAAAAAALPAQVYVPDGTASAGPINNVPMGGKGPTGIYQNLRTQIRVPASFLPGTGATVTDVGFAGGSTGNYTYTRLQVRLAHLAGAALDPTFANNLAGAVLVLDKSSGARFDVVQDQWRTLGLTASFAHDGRRDLVVDVTIQGAFFNGVTPGTRRSDVLESVFAPAYDIGNPAPGGLGPYPTGAKLMLRLGGDSVVIVGTGCPKADARPIQIGHAGAPRLGTTFTLSASAATPNTSLLLLLGANESAFGGLTLPYDLAGLGAPGCVLRTDVLLTLTAGADASGAASLGLKLPDDANLVGRPLLGQWAGPAPGANPLGVVLSAMARATLAR